MSGRRHAVDDVPGEPRPGNSPPGEPSAGEPPAGETSTGDTVAERGDEMTRPLDRTGSDDVDHVLQREVIRAALFGHRTAPHLGPYRIGDRLGAGASSVVYAAHDTKLDRPVAIKIIVAETSKTKRQVQREARALAQLKHRNVVAVHDVGEWNGHSFIVMELIVGTTLARWQTGRSTAELVDAYLQAGRGLEAAHRAGLVHRDFKPANVMVADEGRVVVTDFGLVSDVDAATTQNRATDRTTAMQGVGTPAYVAPEQRRGATPHPSADIYSFALALCEALIGWHPVLHPTREWRRELARRARPRLCAAICTGLADDSTARGSTIEPLLAELARRAEHPVRGGVMTPWLEELSSATRRRWPRRSLQIAAGLVASILIVTLVFRDEARFTGRRTASVATPPGGAQPEAKPVFAALPHAELVERIEAARRAPRDDASAAERRSLLLRPLPSEVACRWPPSSLPLSSLVLGDDYAAALDKRGRVHVCVLDSQAVSIAADDATCVVPARGRTIGVQDRSGQIRAVREQPDGWREIARSASSPFAPSTDPVTMCSFRVVTLADGSVSIDLITGAEARDRGRRIALRSLRARAGFAIVDLDRSVVLGTVDMPRHPMTTLLEISPDGSRMATAGPRGTFFWRTGSEPWQVEPLRFPTGTLRRASFSHDGGRLLLIDLFGRLEVRTPGHARAWWLSAASIRDAIFLDDDTVIAIDVDHRIWRWQLSAQRSGLVASFQQTVWSIASNDEVIAAGSEDGTVIVIDQDTGAVLHRLATGDQIYRTILDGDRLVTAGNGGLHVWSWRTGQQLPIAEGRGLRLWDVVAVAGAGEPYRYVAAALHGGELFSLSASFRDRLHATVVDGRVHGRVHGLVVTPDRRLAAAGTSVGQLIVVDVATSKVNPVMPAPRPAAINRVAFDHATGLIASVHDDGYLRTWSAPDGARRAEIPIGAGAAYDLGVENGLAVSAAGNTVALVDLAEGRVVRKYRGHHAAVTTVQFRPGGRWFVTGDASGKVLLWHVDRTDSHAELAGHSEGVLDAVFAEDGTIYTSSHDGTVRYWRPPYDDTPEALERELQAYGARR